MGFAITAAVLIVLGAACELWALLELGWRRALDLTDAPPDPAEARLVFGGPFGLVRHPQSLGLLLVLAGASLGVRSVEMWLAAAVAGLLVVAAAVRHDRELAAQLGEAYARYRHAVPLLLPRRR